MAKTAHKRKILEMLTDYKKKITPELETPIDLIRLFRFFFRMTGCHPFRVSKKYHGQRELVPVKYALLNFGEIAVIFAVILYGQHMRYQMMDPDDYLSYFGFVAVCITCTASALASCLILYFKRDQVIDAINIMRDTDTDIRQLGITISYIRCFKIACFSCGLMSFAPAILYLSDTPLSKKIFDVVAYYYSITIRCGAQAYPFMYMVLIHERFQQLNKILIVLDDDDDDDYTVEEIELKRKLSRKLSPALILEKVTTIHARLVDISKYYEKSFSLIVLVNVASNVVQSTLTLIIMYSGNHKEITNVELIIVFVICNGVTLGFALFSYFIENEANNTLATLGHLNIYYFDQKLAFKKNTLLLQGLHNKVNFRVSGMFPLKANLLLQQITVCRNLFLLLLQNFQGVIRQER